MPLRVANLGLFPQANGVELAAPIVGRGRGARERGTFLAQYRATHGSGLQYSLCRFARQSQAVVDEQPKVPPRQVSADISLW